MTAVGAVEGGVLTSQVGGDGRTDRVRVTLVFFFFFCGRGEGVMHHGKSAGCWHPLVVCDKSEISACRRCWPGKAGSMRPRKCASGNFPWWLRQYPSSIHGELCFCVRCVALRCVGLLLLAGAERVVCLGAQMTVQCRASQDGAPATKIETVSLCPRI